MMVIHISLYNINPSLKRRFQPYQMLKLFKNDLQGLETRQQIFKLKKALSEIGFIVKKKCWRRVTGVHTYIVTINLNSWVKQLCIVAVYVMRILPSLCIN